MLKTKKSPAGFAYELGPTPISLGLGRTRQALSIPTIIESLHTFLPPQNPEKPPKRGNKPSFSWPDSLVDWNQSWFRWNQMQFDELCRFYLSLSFYILGCQQNSVVFF